MLGGTVKLLAANSSLSLSTVESSQSTNIPHVSNAVVTYGTLTYGHGIGLSAGAGAVFGGVVGGFAAGGFAPGAGFEAGILGLGTGGGARFSISGVARSPAAQTSRLSRAP